MEPLRRELLFGIAISSLLTGLCNGGNPPFASFGPSTGYVRFSEDVPIGTSLFEISATDSDSAEVFIEIDPDNQETVDLVSLGPKNFTQPNRWSVQVLLKKALDRDRQPSSRILVFKVKDEENELHGSVRVYITDVNDNPPLFVNLPYRISLKETAAVNQTVFTFTANDPDDGPGGLVEYSMVSESGGKEVFVIVDKNLGTVRLQKPLDYEDQIYHQYRVYAQDRGVPPCPGPGCKCTNITEPNIVCEGEPTTFTVTVLDVQDTPPFFERQPYIAYVPEDTAVGSTILQVSAMDGDRGVPNEISYSIFDGELYPFTIDARTGVITVVSPGLDADQPDGQSYTVTVVAEEILKPGEEQLGETNTTTKVSITVLDVNDNAPEFSSSSVTARVQENTPRGVPLILSSPLTVSDKDQTEKSQFTLSIEKDGQPFSVFDTLPKQGTVIQGGATVIIRVFNSSAIDYERTQRIIFQIVAREKNSSNSQPPSATVTVLIEDTNDNSPIFPPSQAREVKVTEHDTPGKVLATFSATDADSGDFGAVNYFLEDTVEGKFAIDAQTGQLSVTQDLDREAPGGSSYSLVVLATDNMAGDQASRRSARLNVHVTVQDLNDNAPVFQTYSPSVTVQENAPVGTTLMTLTARDLDSGENGTVFYRIVAVTSTPTSPGNSPYLFTVNRNNGVLSTALSLIGHYGSHVIVVEASDSSVRPLKSTATVTVTVLDVNVHAPVFTNPDERLIITALKKIPEVSVTEEKPPGSLVLQLKAVDDDIGNNSQVYYYLEPDLPDHWQNFRVHRMDGTLTNQYRLDREQTDYFQIYLKAEDNGTPSRLSKVIPLRVNLIDINDNPSVFPSRTLRLSVGEGLENIRVGSVDIATDADSDPENRVKCYYLYGGDLLTSFSLQKLDGELFLQNPISRNVTPAVNLIVKVTPDCSLPENHFYISSNNSFNSSDNSLLRVVVTVVDVNDNPPVLDKSSLTVGMLYDVPIGSSVFELQDYTYDADTEIHRQNKFRLLNTKVSGDMPNDFLTPAPFKITVNGSVLTQRLFRADLLGFFILTVQAYDNDNQTDNGDLKIYLVSDIQRIKLVFVKEPEEVRAFQGELVRKLSRILAYDVIADRVATHVRPDGQLDVKMTDLFIHARYRPTEEIVPTGKLESAFDYNEAVWSIFQEYGVRYALPALRLETEEDNSLLRAFIVVVTLLVIICLTLLIVLFTVIHKCRRKLLAASSSAYNAAEKQAPDTFVPPGTNKYLATENPLYEHDDLDKRGSSADSLDDNALNDGRNDPVDEDSEEEQEIYLQMHDEDSKEPSVNFSPLAMVLNEYDDKHGGPAVSSVSSSFVSGYKSNWMKNGHVTARNDHMTSDSGFEDSIERVWVRVT